jgi:hypothetical protein
MLAESVSSVKIVVSAGYRVMSYTQVQCMSYEGAGGGSVVTRTCKTDGNWVTVAQPGNTSVPICEVIIKGTKIGTWVKKGKKAKGKRLR